MHFLETAASHNENLLLLYVPPVASSVVPAE